MPTGRGETLARIAPRAEAAEYLALASCRRWRGEARGGHGPDAGRAVHRLSDRGAGGRLFRLHAGAVPAAGRAGGVAGADLRAAGRARHAAARLALARDGAAVSRPTSAKWCGRSFATISPGSTGRWCWSMRWARSMPGPRRSRTCAARWPISCRPSGPGGTVLLGELAARQAGGADPLCRHQGRPPAPHASTPA